jgi:hypothetical protein
MSRGLGRRQLDLLLALHSLGDAGAGCCWRMSAIVNRFYERSADLLAREARLQDAIAIREKNDPMFAMPRSAIVSLLARGRPKRRMVPVNFDIDLNPSRIMAALGRRGLVESPQWGCYRLTATGSDMCRVYSSAPIDLAIGSKTVAGVRAPQC